MRSKSVLSPVVFVAFIFLFIASGLAQDSRSEVSIQGTVDLPKNSTNIDIPHDATKSGGFLIGYRYHLNSWFAVQGDLQSIPSRSTCSPDPKPPTQSLVEFPRETQTGRLYRPRSCYSGMPRGICKTRRARCAERTSPKYRTKPSAAWDGSLHSSR